MSNPNDDIKRAESRNRMLKKHMQESDFENVKHLLWELREYRAMARKAGRFAGMKVCS